jgi:hypothetical protein
METAAKAFFFCVAIASSVFALWVLRAGYYPWKHGPVVREQQPLGYRFRVAFLFGVTAMLLYPVPGTATPPRERFWRLRATNEELNYNCAPWGHFG